MPYKIACSVACACNLAKHCMRMQFSLHAIAKRWLSFNSSELQECCPMRWNTLVCSQPSRNKVQTSRTVLSRQSTECFVRHICSQVDKLKLNQHASPTSLSPCYTPPAPPSASSPRAASSPWQGQF